MEKSFLNSINNIDALENLSEYFDKKSVTQKILRSIIIEKLLYQNKYCKMN
jgi:hypothetical protein